MRTLGVILLVGLCALANSNPTERSGKESNKIQKDIYRLFKHVNQPSYDKDFIEIANSFKFGENFDGFTKPEHARQFYNYYTRKNLPRGEIFSVFNKEHLDQAIALFRTLHYAKDYETFFKMAVWARQNVNEGLFVYAFSTAVVHTPLTMGILLPPIYETFPQYFFNDEVIYKAQQYKQLYFRNKNKEEIKDGDYDGYTIEANYSGSYLNVDPEQSMSYFTEDVGLNSYYYFFSIHSPFWLEQEEMAFDETIRSEYFYYGNKQILTRYYLERLSNGFGEIPQFEYEYPIETGYYPSLSYTNGFKFPTRPNHAHLYYHGVHGKQSYSAFGNNSYPYTYVKDYERRIRDALERGFVYTPEGKMVYLYSKDGFKTFCDLVHSNKNSVNERYYGDLHIFARRLLGYSYYPLNDNKLTPSALEHFETSLRDPMFYQLYKRILSFLFQYQQNMGPYNKNELLFEGVEVEDFEVDRLTTYFDYFYADLSNAVYVNENEFNEDTVQVRARQYRLNHKPFNYKITVNSNKQTEAFVKVFIGPKYDEYGREIEMKNNYLNFFEFDRFRTTLKPGKTVIERNSLDSHILSKDRTTYKQLYKEALTAYLNNKDFVISSPGDHYSMPQRLLLPKGTTGGQTFQVYVMVNEYHKQAEDNIISEYLIDREYSIGYPFDRPVEFEEDFFVPNSLIKDVVVYHKDNLTKLKNKV